MLTVTEAAFKRLTQMTENLSEDVSVRLIRQDKRTKVARGTRRPGDTEVTHENKVILRFGEIVANRVKNKVLDVRQTENGPRLGLRKTND